VKQKVAEILCGNIGSMIYILFALHLKKKWIQSWLH